MRRFTELFRRLDRTSSTERKVEALADYFRNAPPEDAAWGLYFLSGRKLKRVVPARVLAEWAAGRAGISAWLFEECRAGVGDLAETCALLVARAPEGDTAVGGVDHREARGVGLRDWVEGRLLPLRGEGPESQGARLTAWAAELDRDGLFLLLKMLTGAMRLGVSKTLAERAIARVAGVEPALIAQALAGRWEPTPGMMRAVLSGEAEDDSAARPLPFCLASQIVPPEGADTPEDETAPVARALGDPEEWSGEWKWDGIRAQLVKRGGRVLLWSRGDEDLTERFPDLIEPAARLPDGVTIDGEVLCWTGGRPMGFDILQTRIGRTNVGSAILARAPAAMVAYDLLTEHGRDLREHPLEHRRDALRRLLDGRSPRLMVSEELVFGSWNELAALRAESRRRGVEGLMLKRRGSVYRSGRRRGDWWKWKIEPLTLDLVLVYAQPGHGRRSGLMTDYTFAAWSGDPTDGGELVTVTKAYSGLSDAEFREVDEWIRAHTLERFGPVRRVEPVLVFELAFDAVRPSTRHASGLAMRFPRMKRWRRDKPAWEANLVEDARAMARDEDRDATPDEPRLDGSDRA